MPSSHDDGGVGAGRLGRSGVGPARRSHHGQRSYQHQLLVAAPERRCSLMAERVRRGRERTHAIPWQSIDNTAAVREFCECLGPKIKQQPKPLFVFHHTPDLLCNPRFIQNLG